MALALGGIRLHTIRSLTLSKSSLCVKGSRVPELFISSAPGQEHRCSEGVEFPLLTS
jgi:hypothetical protein